MSDVYPAIEVTESSGGANDSWSRTFIRHADGEGGNWLSTKVPFNTHSGSGGDKQLPVRWSPRGKWQITVALTNRSWAPAISNAADGLAVFEENSKSRRLEIVVVGYDGSDKGWFFWMNRAGKQAVRYQLPVKFADRPAKAKFKAIDLRSDFIADCESGRAAVEKLCHHFDVDVYGSRLEIVGDRATIIDAEGNSLNEFVAGYSMRDGYALDLGEDPAADALHMAILADDEMALREAVAAGARLDVLSGRSLTPLKQAISRSGTADGERCTIALIELGCPIDGDDWDEPPLCWCRERPEQVRLLLSLGANVNVVDPHDGRTALFSLVANSSESAERDQSIRLLVQHGVNPAIPDRRGQTVLDWLEAQIARTGDDVYGFKRIQRLRETLSLITGRAAGEPQWREMTKYSSTARPELAECVGARSPNLDPAARFFDDLGGSQRALRFFAMRMSNRLQVPMLPVLASACALIHVDGAGRPTEESMQRLQEFLPGWRPHVPLERFQDVLTVALLEAVVDKGASADHGSSATAANPFNIRQRVRKRFAELTGIPLERLTPQSFLAADVTTGLERIGALYSSLQEYFGIDCVSVVREVEQQFSFDSHGRLSASACERVVDLLPHLNAALFDDMTVDDVLFSVAGVESIALAANARQPKARCAESPIGGDLKAWVRNLAAQIGERRFRLLLAGACRYALDDWDLTRKEVAGALHAFEEWVDTGRREAAVRDAHRRFRGAWIDSRRPWRNQPNYTALNRLLALEDTGVLEDVLHSLARQRNISGIQAEKELALLARDLTPPEGTPTLDHRWRSPDVVEVAPSAYESRDFRRMFGLADALQRAGCVDESILEHCRDPLQVHVRGCWVVDALREVS